MGAIAQFVYNDWVAMFPEMAGVTSLAASGFFTRATLYLRNDGASPVIDANEQTILLYLMTAHIAYLNSPRDASGLPVTDGSSSAPQLVGRIQSAAQGSVNVAMANDITPMTASEAWYQQTKYGAEFWSATLPFRTARYRRGRTRIFDPFLVGTRPWPFA